MTKNDFTELAYNDHRTALLYLFGELVAVQETILELSAAIHAGDDAPAAN